MWMFGRERDPDSYSATAAMKKWFLLRPEEIYHRALEAGVREPTVLVLVHNPEDVNSAELPIQSWCGVVVGASCPDRGGCVGQIEAG